MIVNKRDQRTYHLARFFELQEQLGIKGTN